MSNHNKAIIALIVTNIIWGAAAPVFKWSFGNIEPFTLAFLRYFIAAFILLPFALKNLSIKRQDIPSVFLLTFFGITINISFFFLALPLTASINVPIIGSSAAIFIILGSMLFLREKPKSKVVMGTLLSLLGVLTIVVRPILETGLQNFASSASIIGNLLLIFGTLGAVVHTLIQREIGKDYSPQTIAFWSFVIGSISFIPMMFFEVKEMGFLTNLNPQGITGIVFGAVLSSALAYTLYNFSLKYMVAGEVGVFFYLDPVIAILIAVPLLGEMITLPYIFGSLLVFSGLFLAEGHLPYHPSLKLRRG